MNRITNKGAKLAGSIDSVEGGCLLGWAALLGDKSPLGVKQNT